VKFEASVAKLKGGRKTNYNKRVFEMLVHVLVFRSTNKDLIGDDSQVNQLLQQVETALNPGAHSPMILISTRFFRRPSNSP